MCHGNLRLYYPMVLSDKLYTLMYMYIYIFKIGGNENNAQFSKQRGKLPYFFEIKVIIR